jgi:hypothetical protein
MVQNFHFSISSKPALEFTQSRIQWALGLLTWRVKRQEREAHHPRLSNGRGEETVDLYIHSTISLHGVVLS